VTDHWNSMIAGMRSLLSDLAEVQDMPGGECRAMRENLDLLVSDELDGIDVRVRHPNLWRHLQVCAVCREAHDDLLELMTMMEAPAQQELPPLKMVAEPPPAEPWHLLVEMLPDRPGASLLFLFAPDYLQKSLQPVARFGKGQRAVFDPARIGADRLLLSYLGEIEGHEVMVQLYARPDADDPSHCTLSVVAVGDPMPSAVALTWGGQPWNAALGPDGDAHLGPVPLAALTGPDLSPEFFSLRILP